MAYYDGLEIKWIARWGKNGRKYVWENPTQKKLDQLVKKYGVEQIAGDWNDWGIWLNW